VAAGRRHLNSADEDQIGRGGRIEIVPMRDGVVISHGEEIEAGLLGCGMQQDGRACGVGMVSMAMQVAAIPAGTRAMGTRQARGGVRRAGGVVARDMHGDLGPIRGQAIEAEDDMPGPGRHRPGQISRSGGVAAQVEPVARPTGPAAKAGWAGKGLRRAVEQTEINHAIGGLGIGQADRKLRGALGHIKRQVDIVAVGPRYMARDHCHPLPPPIVKPLTR